MRNREFIREEVRGFEFNGNNGGGGNASHGVGLHTFHGSTPMHVLVKKYKYLLSTIFFLFFSEQPMKI